MHVLKRCDNKLSHFYLALLQMLLSFKEILERVFPLALVLTGSYSVSLHLVQRQRTLLLEVPVFGLAQ